MAHHLGALRNNDQIVEKYIFIIVAVIERCHVGTDQCLFVLQLLVCALRHVPQHIHLVYQICAPC